MNTDTATGTDAPTDADASLESETQVSHDSGHRSSAIEPFTCP
jgi:hypothetical protein